MLSSSFDGLCRLWDTETGKCLRTIIDESNPPVSMARFSPNGKFVLIGSLDGRIKLWDYEKQKHIKTYTGKPAALPVEVKGKSMVRGTFAFPGALTLDAAGHKNTSFCLFAGFIVTHPSGNLVLSGSEDNAIYFYNLNTQQASHRPLPPQMLLASSEYKPGTVASNLPSACSWCRR